ncbi:MAG: hypothetical protein AB2697_21640, partial [Candidatus Thiodiazotropha endolucinida]
MAFSEGKATIILGAGASCEAGLPVGRDLKSKIARLIDIRYEEGFTPFPRTVELRVISFVQADQVFSCALGCG